MLYSILWLSWFGLLIESQGYSSVSPAVADLRLASQITSTKWSYDPFTRLATALTELDIDGIV